MDQQSVTQAAQYIQATAQRVHQMSAAGLQTEIRQLNKLIDRIIQADFESSDVDFRILLNRLETAATRCRQCLLDRLAMAN